MKYDFGGYVTRNDLKCSDGRTIRHGAFKDCDGATVPLVWQHLHDSPENVLGHAVLENRDDGVYGYCTLNDSEVGQQAKTLVRHGDIKSLSIYANQLKQQGGDVLHGVIREVSLVLAGANPGAYIDNLSFSHSDGTYEKSEDEAIMYFNDDLSMDLEHADQTEESKEEDMGEETIADVFDSLTEKQKDVVYAVIGTALSGEAEEGEGENAEAEHSAKDEETLKHADDGAADDSVEAVFNTLSETQKEAVYAIIGMALEDAAEHGETEEEGQTMKHNVFDNETGEDTQVLTHSDMEAIIDDAKRIGSVKEAFLQHGITNIEALFPEDKAVNAQPYLITRPMEWVAGVLNSVHKSPFSKVKSTAANITADEARAKGYVKGTQKVEEVIKALRRAVDATTIYKLQKLDRDDVVDITDFDVIAWMKQEMRTMLEEELARAILVGDGRDDTAPDKIKEDKIIPVWKDEETYTTHVAVDSSLTGEAKAKAFIDATIRARRFYKGSGAPTLYVGTDLLTEMRLIRDRDGHRLYKNDQELADELRVSKIVEIELLDGLMRESKKGNIFGFGGLVVNLADYNVGANKGGEVTMFDDFDLDFNKYEYLIETRCSGALTRPLSALAIEFGDAEEGGDDSE